MNGRTRLLIGITLVALGAGVVALGYTGSESNVRYVEDLLARPQAHERGSFVLMGVPQPQQVPSKDRLHLEANEKWANTTSATVRWSDGTQEWFSTRTTTVQLDGLTALWTYRNETRHLPSDPELAMPVQTATWTTQGLRAFTVQAFDDGDGDTPRVWALYDGPVKEAMEPKPSQFTGRLLATLPDGSPLPNGVQIYTVDEYKAGCSSKFLPPEEQEQQSAA